MRRKSDLHFIQINQLQNTINILNQQISFLNDKVKLNSQNNQILNERINKIQNNVYY